MMTLWILLFVAVVCQLGYSEPFDSQVKICGKIYLSHQNEPTRTLGIERIRLNLKNYINGCQYVNGDVELKSFGVKGDAKVGGNFDQLKTDFFDSIEEIAGRLIIRNVNLAVLEFKNLQVIRGKNFEKITQKDVEAISIVLVRWPMTLRLPKLIAITNGNVVLRGDFHWSLYGFLKHKINWQLLFQGESKQQLIDQVNHIIGCDAANCAAAPTCSRKCQSSSASNCWSGGSEGCQSNRHLCNHDNQCNSCFRDGRNYSERCCNRNCLGGCSDGSGPEKCNACLQFNREGACANHCSDDEDSDSPKLIPLLDHLCVKACPLPFLHRQSSCVAECSDYELPVKKRCEKCRECNRVCLIGETVFLSDKKALELQAMNCKVWKALSSLDVGNRGSLSRGSLPVLNDLFAFYGTLLITGVDKLGVDRIDFLRNLQYVSTKLAIFRMKVRYLGLGRLRYARILMLWNISGLCKQWYPKNHIERFEIKLKRVTIDNVTFDNSSQECLNARCHAECGGSECWGPDADMCTGEIWEN